MKTAEKRIALKRIHMLFQSARAVINEDEELAQRHVAIARRISMASRVRIPREYRRQVCRECKKFILPGVNCRVRIQHRRSPHVVITCGYCGKHMRILVGSKRERDDNAKN